MIPIFAHPNIPNPPYKNQADVKKEIKKQNGKQKENMEEKNNNTQKIIIYQTDDRAVKINKVKLQPYSVVAYVATTAADRKKHQRERLS